MNNVTPLPIASDNNGRDLRGRFASGNIGRPYGAKAKHSRELMKVVRAMGPRAVEKLSNGIDNNERWAVELVLKYCLPSARTIELEGAEPEDIKQAFISGDLSADEAKSIATALEKLKNVSDLDDLRNRLADLEKLLVQQSR
jgi:hypothetical protein